MLIKAIQNSDSKKLFRAAALAVFTIFLAGRFFIVGPAHTAVSHGGSAEKDTALQEKIEKYKKFKKKYEDKDFRLIGTPVKRTELSNGTTRSYDFNVYHIVYGITEDNFREYNGYSKQITRTPIHPVQGSSPVCQSGLYMLHLQPERKISTEQGRIDENRYHGRVEHQQRCRYARGAHRQGTYGDGA